MTGCEICGQEVKDELTDDPVEDQYFTYVSASDIYGQPNEFVFCSLGHLRAFTPEEYRGATIPE